MALYPGGLLMWLVAGLIAGWLAGKFMKGSGFGMVGDLVIGSLGAFLGGLLFGVVMPGNSVGFPGTIVVAFMGAVVLIGLLRTLSGGTWGLGNSWRG